jgi:hypothetical protein
LELINLGDAFDNFLVAPLISLNIQIMPDEKLLVKSRIENLLLKTVPHVHHFCEEQKFIGTAFLADLYRFHSFVPDSLPHQSPILVIDLLAARGLLDIESHDFLANSDQVLNILLHPGGDHAKVVSLDVSSAFVVAIAVIKLIQDINLFLKISC